MGRVNTNFGSEYGVEKLSVDGKWSLIHPTGQGTEDYQEAHQKVCDLVEATGKPHRVVVYNYDGVQRSHIRNVRVVG